MKKILFAVAIVISFIACSNNGSKENQTKVADSTQPNTSANDNMQKKPVSIDDIVTAYLRLKNALVNDNGTEAASAGKAISNALQKIDEAALTAEQKKVYDDVVEELKEHAEHIAENAGKIGHQREHFSWLSEVVYDLVKVFKTDKTLYKDRCLMFNDNKGAIWLSEVRQIKNPYYGKKMLTCGVVKEEIK
ncbi:MAG TPA: DUF3347 domain-containing protein [Chitinophagaceae bacterium]|nr:DUF3347 domain-containing protein [Chitinophagaceae bacterium]